MYTHESKGGAPLPVSWVFGAYLSIHVPASVLGPLDVGQRVPQNSFRIDIDHVMCCMFFVFLFFDCVVSL
jgi:hypothetical protein